MRSHRCSAALFAGLLTLASVRAIHPQSVPTKSSWWRAAPVITAWPRAFRVTAIVDRALLVFHVVSDTPFVSATARGVSELAIFEAGEGSPRAGADLIKRGDTLRIRVGGLERATTYYLALVVRRAGADSATGTDEVEFFTVLTVPRQVARVFIAPSVHRRVGYLVYLPDTVYVDPLAKAPLLVFLHGAHEKGNGESTLYRVLKHGPPHLIAAGLDFPFIVISPQLPSSERAWSTALIDDVVAGARAAFPVDSTRIYLTGLSDVGDASWRYAMTRPERVAAIVPIAAEGDTAGICRMRDVAVWAFHGERDQDEEIARHRALVNAYNACLPAPREEARLTVFPGASHNVWKGIYDGSAGYDIYAWLLSHHR